MLAFTGGGLALLFGIVRVSPRGAGDVEPLGALLFLFASIAGLIACLKARRDERNLVARLREQATDGRLRRVDAPSGDAVGLAAAINDVVAAAERAVTDAHLRAKELEIQLKVAT